MRRFIDRLRAPARTILFCLACATIAKTDGPGVLLSSRADSDFALSADPGAEQWQNIRGVIAAFSPFGKPLPEAQTEIRSRWTEKYLYFLFISKYQELYLNSKPVLTQETWELWNHDVAEAFIGPDLKNTQVYKEFEVSPQGEYIDLDINRSRSGHEGDAHWDSGWHVKARINERQKLWFCEMQIPWKSIFSHPPGLNDELRLNLYRIEGGPVERKYVVWQLTNSASFHTPSSFGRLRLVR